MSRRLRGQNGGAVRGPASALTSFLAGLGVEPSARLTTWGNTSSLATPNDGGQEEQLAHDGPIINPDAPLDPAGAVTARTVEAGPTEVGDGVPVDDEGADASALDTSRKLDDVDSDTLDSPAPPSKRARRRGASVDSDDLDNEPSTSTAAASGVSTPAVGATKKGKGKGKKVAPGPLKQVGQFMTCGECTKQFTVTAYTKEHPTEPSTWLCVNCCYTLGINPFEKAKKAAVKKAPAGKEQRGKVISYEERKGVSNLGDLCIEIVGKFIENVERLGDIGGVNMEKVCKIISKSRRLTAETAKLFYDIDRTELDLYDCTALTEESYIAMGNLCPRVERLNLYLCGQLSTNSVLAWAKSLTQLKRVELLGPFLVRKEGWLSLFESRGAQLEGLLVTQSPRIDLDIVSTLVKQCPNLTELRLSEIGLLNNEFLEPLAKLKNLKSLDLSSPGSSLSDDFLAAFLESAGAKLESLNLSDNPDLTDATLMAIAQHCPKLRRLHLRHLVELTDEGVSEFFEQLSKNGHPGLEVIDFEKGHDLKGKALRSLVKQSGKTVEKLSLLGWREVDAKALEQLKACKQLKELDLGWCRKVTDYTVKDILDNCNEIKLVKVWGCNQLTDAVPRKRGVKVIGIETHTI